MMFEPDNITPWVRNRIQPKQRFVRRITQQRLLSVDDKLGLITTLTSVMMFAKMQRKKSKKQSPLRMKNVLATFSIDSIY